MNEPASVTLRRIARRIAVVVAGYLCYVAAIWMLDSRALGVPTGDSLAKPRGDARSGRQVWLASGCATCHSLVGLGGHVGPDLTNYGRPEMAPIVRSTVRLGRVNMPAFALTDRELDDLVAFLASVSHAASYPPLSPREPAFGATP